MTEIPFAFEYTHSYLPSPRHRKMVQEERTHAMFVQLRDVTSVEAPIVMEAWYSDGFNASLVPVVYRQYNDKLFCSANYNEHWRSYGNDPTTWRVDDVTNFNLRLEENLNKIHQWANDHIIVDGYMYSARTVEILWKVSRYGDWPNIHMQIRTEYNTYGNEGWANYFRADQLQEAIAYAQSLWANFPEVDIIPEIEGQITVYDPSVLRFDPLKVVGEERGYWGREYEIRARVGVQGYWKLVTPLMQEFNQLLEQEPISMTKVQALFKKLPHFVDHDMRRWILSTIEYGLPTLKKKEIRMLPKTQEYTAKMLKNAMSQLFNDALYNAVVRDSDEK